MQCVWRAIGNDHLRRVLRAPSRRGSEQEEARGAGRRLVALGIGHFHADKNQSERHVRRDWFCLNQRLRHFSDPAEAGSNPADFRLTWGSAQLDVKFVPRVGRVRQRFYQSTATAIDEATRSRVLRNYDHNNTKTARATRCRLSCLSRTFYISTSHAVDTAMTSTGMAVPNIFRSRGSAVALFIDPCTRRVHPTCGFFVSRGSCVSYFQ